LKENPLSRKTIGEWKNMQINKEILTREVSEKEVENFLNQFPELRIWLRKKGIKTQYHYTRRLIKYLETLKLNNIAETPQNLLDLAKDNGEFGTKHVEILEEFQISCEDTIPDRKALIFNTTTTIKSFYSFKGRMYQFPKGRGDFAYTQKKPKIVPKREDVIPYIETISHLRNKMICAVETSFPIRLESWVFLKWRHFKEVLEGKTLPHVFIKGEEMKGKGREQYKGIEQHSFLTNFSKRYVLLWKEEYEQLTNRKIDLNDSESLEQPFLISYKGETKGESLSYGGLNQLFDRAKTEKYPFTIHQFRTYVNEGLKRANVLKEDRNVILGHKEQRVESAYSELNLERLREEFKKAIPYLDPEHKEEIPISKFKEAFRKQGIEISEDAIRKVLEESMQKMITQLVNKGTD
jgi:hypothetical protein